MTKTEWRQKQANDSEAININNQHFESENKTEHSSYNKMMGVTKLRS